MARILKDYPSVSLDPEHLAGKIDFVTVFGRAGAVHIEIGSGKGTFLLNQAKARPEVNFLGIEWAGRYYRWAVDRIGRWGLANVRIIRADAGVFIGEHVADGSVDCFHIYFPDPWPKKRHHKRRFIQQGNLGQLLRRLKPGGRIRIATDHEEYFEQIRRVIAAAGDRLAEIDFLPTAGADTGEWVGTNFERKYLKERRSIHTIAVEKTLAPPNRAFCLRKLTNFEKNLRKSSTFRPSVPPRRIDEDVWQLGVAMHKRRSLFGVKSLADKELRQPSRSGLRIVQPSAERPTILHAACRIFDSGADLATKPGLPTREFVCGGAAGYRASPLGIWAKFKTEISKS